MSTAQEKVTWKKKNATDWFNKREWLPTAKAETVVKYDAFGRIIEQETSDTSVVKVTHIDLAKLKPHESIDKVAFVKEYQANPERWKTAFSFLQTADLDNIKPGKHLIDSENVYALVTEGPARKEDTTKWESHHNYIDIHYVIKGQEKIGIAPVASARIVTPYNKTRDIVFYTAKGKYYKADERNFFILFPKEAHKPNLQLTGNDPVKKVVVKIKRN
jgi:biofilm protein TabA